MQKLISAGSREFELLFILGRMRASGLLVSIGLINLVVQSNLSEGCTIGPVDYPCNDERLREQSDAQGISIPTEASPASEPSHVKLSLKIQDSWIREVSREARVPLNSHQSQVD